MYTNNTATAANAQNAQIAGQILNREEISELFSDCFDGNWFGDRQQKPAKPEVVVTSANDDAADQDFGNDFMAKMRARRLMALKSVEDKTTDRERVAEGSLEARPSIAARIPRPVMMAPMHLGQHSVMGGSASAIAAQ